MARLPTVGGDINNWGTVLNEYLLAGHNADGTHLPPPVVPPGGTSVTTGNFVISGGFVIWQTGLTFLVSASVYVIQGTEYTSVQQSITLDAADGSNPRIDVIGLDTAGAAFKVTGTPAASPSEPNVDPITQLQLAFVTIATGASTPTGISNTLLYAEDTGSLTEWDWTVNDADWVHNSTTDPRTGTKCIRGTALDNNDAITGTIGASSVDINNFDRLLLYIKLPAAWSSGRSLQVEFLNSSSVRQGVAVSIADGLWGFSRTNITTYQVIVLPTIYFQVTIGTAITKVRFTAIGSGGTMGCGIDDVNLQVHPSGNVTVTGLTQDQADARYIQLGNVANADLVNVTSLPNVSIAKLTLTQGADVAVNSQALSGTLTLTTSSKRYQSLDPDGSARNVDLPAEAEGLAFFIVNRGNGGEVITVRNDAAGTVDTINNNEGLSVICDGTRWLSAKATLVIV